MVRAYVSRLGFCVRGLQAAPPGPPPLLHAIATTTKEPLVLLAQRAIQVWPNTVAAAAAATEAVTSTTTAAAAARLTDAAAISIVARLEELQPGSLNLALAAVLQRAIVIHSVGPHGQIVVDDTSKAAATGRTSPAGTAPGQPPGAGSAAAAPRPRLRLRESSGEDDAGENSDDDDDDDDDEGEPEDHDDCDARGLADLDGGSSPVGAPAAATAAAGTSSGRSSRSSRSTRRSSAPAGTEPLRLAMVGHEFGCVHYDAVELILVPPVGQPRRASTASATVPPPTSSCEM
jgi:hypothetical protein